MSSLRLTLAALGDPVLRRVRGMRRRLAAHRAWASGGAPHAAGDPDALPEPFHYGNGELGRLLAGGEWRALGQAMALGERSIWSLAAPDPRLEAERESFGWLGDLAAFGTRAARTRAQVWTLEWIRHCGRGAGPGWRPDLAGRRMMRWTAQARFLTASWGEAEAARFWSAVAVHGRVLRETWREAPAGLGQVEALAGAVMALTLLGEEAAEAAIVQLAHLSEAVVDGGGGTPSRAPEELAEIVIALIWTARVIEGAGRQARPGQLHAIARAVPVIRALRLGDGTMARFHGGGPGDPHRLDQALAELRLPTRAKARLPMGYARLAGGRLIAVMDGAPPASGPGAAGGAAATLAFELTAGRTPLVVNMGPGGPLGAAARAASRATAAYSTVEVDGRSSARFCRPGLAARLYGGWIDRAPSHVSVRQAQDHTGQWLLATHDGYVEELGLLHERRLFVDSRGGECRGEEIVYVTDGRAQKRFDAVAKRRKRNIAMAARFHLHPEVAALVDPARQIVELRPPGIDAWLFRCAGGRVELRDSWYFDPGAPAPIPTLQIMVIVEIIEYLGQINWSFTRLGVPALEPRRRAEELT